MGKWLSRAVFTILSFFFCVGLFPQIVQAETSCENKYLTLINPVRGRTLWFNKSVAPLLDQYSLVKEKDFPATWLMQYDAFKDGELLAEIAKFDSKQEMGLFLEVSKDLAQDSRVTYPPLFDWTNPRVVFLSGYSRSERKKIIDHLFTEFNGEFGYYPESVGAWWIDSYSLNYMEKEYGVKSALIVADQLSTDDFGVWGQWWGVSYYPLKTNVLLPASSLSNKQDIVILQWAQRHPDLAYGDGPKFSNHSLQANDYISLGFDTDFFSSLVDTYSDCVNPISQVTVGLETGMESVGFLDEYEKQLEVLENKEYLVPLTMSQYGEKFREVHPGFPKEAKVIGTTTWEMTTSYRRNEELGDFIEYNPRAVFSDYYVANEAEFLNRRLPELEVTDNGWRNAFNFSLFQVLNVGVFFLLILYFYFSKKPVWLVFLSVFISILLGFVRVSLLTGKYYLGFALDAFRFVGVSFKRPFQLSFVNQDFYNLKYFINPNLNSFVVYTLLSFLLAHLWPKLSRKK